MRIFQLVFAAVFVAALVRLARRKTTRPAKSVVSGGMSVPSSNTPKIDGVK